MGFRRQIAGLVILIILMPAQPAAAGRGRRTSVVVVPIHNKINDSESDAAASRIRELLGKNRDLHVVTKRNIDSVLHYYDRASISPVQKGVEELLARAKDNYYRFNYIEAKSIARRAIADVKNDPDTLYDSGQNLIDAYLTLGIISRSMGDVGEARQAFREALRLDPEYRLDSRAFPPSMVNIFEGVRESTSLVPKGDLKVVSKPKVAEVYINGVLKGVTPVTIKDLPEGNHYIKIGANKYETVRKKVDVRAGTTTRVREELAWLGGERGELTGKDFVTHLDNFDQLGEAIGIADLLRVERVVLVDVDGRGDASKGAVSARVVDARYRTGHHPIVVPYGDGGGLDEAVAELSDELVQQIHLSVASNPEMLSDPAGSGDPVLMGSREQRRISKPVAYGILGGVLAVGLGAGLAAAFAGGGGGGDSGTGGINVEFR